MYTPNLANRAAVLRDNYGNYLIAQLLADPIVAAEADTFLVSQQGLTEAITQHDASKRTSLEAFAARDRGHKFLDDEIRAFSHSVRRSSLHDFRSPLYRHYFPNGTPSITSAPLAVTMVKVEDILSKLASEGRPELTAHVQPLTTALQSVRDALNLRQQAKVAESKAWAALLQEKRLWRDAYLQVYARLRLTFHDEPRRSDLYFRKAKAGRREDADEGDSVEVQPTATAALAAATDTDFDLDDGDTATGTSAAA